ncbi:MAG: sigma-70 family RNA polymerase sigma factor, partial [Myxococcales bacterium]|nr:sigma-70 family RNA polymerase sigma factor [Myxococcales bacterium]
ANSQPVYSMNDEGGAVFAEVIEDTKTRSPEDETLFAMELSRMRELLEKLDSREARILRLRFGLGNGEPMTLKAIGKRFGLTRERVRQMEQQALEKLGDVMSREFGEDRPPPRTRARRRES